MKAKNYVDALRQGDYVQALKLYDFVNQKY